MFCHEIFSACYMKLFCMRLTSKSASYDLPVQSIFRALIHQDACVQCATRENIRLGPPWCYLLCSVITYGGHAVMGPRALATTFGR